MMLKPPDEYDSWLKYAIATMDTRDLYNQQFFEDEMPNPLIDREQMRDAARAELAALRKDSERLEWLFKRMKTVELHINRKNECCCSYLDNGLWGLMRADSFRAVIDAAKEAEHAKQI